MTRTSLQLTSLATVFVLLASLGCSSAPSAIPVTKGAAARAQPPAAQVATRDLGEETLSAPDASRNLGGQRNRAEVEAEPGSPLPAVQPPDPQTILASIGPSTAPQRAASIRLTDEGRRLLAQGDTDAAVDRLEKAVKIDPSNAHTYYCLAQVYDHLGRPDQALGFIDKAIVLFAQDDRVWLAQAYTFRGSILERTGRFRDARVSYQRALQAEPGLLAARAGAARLGDAPGAP